MITQSPTVADPLTLPCGLVLPNRLVKAAMTEGLSDANNDASPRLERLYERFAAGGAGLLLTGNVMVDRRHLERARNVVADAATDRAALRRWAAATGSVPTLVQLSHPGRQTNRFVQSHPVAPSAVDAVGLAGMFARPRALTPDEIGQVKARFVAAGRLVVDAGFDGVQVHAAHGYLLSSFVSSQLNLRDDAYGRDLAGRARLLLEIVSELRAELPAGTAIAVKLNSSDGGGTSEQALADLVDVAGWLKSAGADLLEISGGNYESPELLGLDSGQDNQESYFSSAAEAVAGAVDIPVMQIGGFSTRCAMDAALASGASLIGVARPLAADPAAAGRLLAGEIDELPRPGPRLGGPAYVQRLLGMAANTGWHVVQMEGHAGQRRPTRLAAALAAADYITREAALSLVSRRRRLATAARTPPPS